jgi:hypothetical protein
MGILPTTAAILAAWPHPRVYCADALFGYRLLFSSSVIS